MWVVATEIALGFFAQLVTSIWWAAKIDERVKTQGKEIAELKTAIADIRNATTCQIR